jgi:GT2 family glycosyltransferase
MSILYAIPTLNQIDWVLEKHVPSIGNNLIDGLVIHMSEFSGSKEQADKVNGVQYPSNIEVIWTRSENNLGVAASWNLFLKIAFEIKDYSAVIIANDDIILGNNTLQSILEKAKEFPDAVISAGPEDSRGNEFSLFYIPRSVHELIGNFDEQFYPAYFEDNDYQYRMKLNNVPLIKSGGDAYYHKGSATINTYTPERMKKHHHDFDENEFRYVQTWGGIPGKEVVTG